ncbi:MAG TPA: signal peptidase I [Terriglobales bacterium]|jgi:signal peptidase I|nr:signal peptidase I [Terriglobales bacterium]
MPPKPQPGKKEKKRETPLEFLASMAAVVVTALFILTFNLQAFEIPSGSMENTLLIGDHVFVDRITYAPASRWIGPVVPYREIRRGDIIVFFSPAQADLHLVKRVVGVPGDRLRLRDGVLFVNGQRQVEPYVIHSLGDYRTYRDNFPAVAPTYFDQVTDFWEAELPRHIQNGDVVVPPDCFFAMGDNRDVSWDSRYWGFVPRQNILGRPMFIYWSFETPPLQYEKTGVADRVAFAARVVIHFFGQTRWRRSFSLVR